MARLAQAITPITVTKARENIAKALSVSLAPNAPLVKIIADYRQTVFEQRNMIPGSDEKKMAILPDQVAIQYFIHTLSLHPRFNKVLKTLNDLDDDLQIDLEATLNQLLAHMHLVEDYDATRPNMAHAVDDDAAPDSDEGEAAVTRAPNRQKPANKPGKNGPRPQKAAQPAAATKDDETVLLLPLSGRNLAHAQRKHVTFGAPAPAASTPIATTVHYCWSHGITTHSSADCTKPKPGHQRQATSTNMMGGNAHIAPFLTKKPS